MRRATEPAPRLPAEAIRRVALRLLRTRGPRRALAAGVVAPAAGPARAPAPDRANAGAPRGRGS